MILWLDDIRKPWAHGYLGAEWAKTADEAIAALKTGKVEFASLDHDLDWEHYPGSGVLEADYKQATGMAVVKWLQDNPAFWPIRGVRCHSFNDHKRPLMQAIVRAHYGRDF